MTTVQWLSGENQDEWDAFVETHPCGLVYHLSSWKNALHNAFGHIRGRFLVLKNDDGQIEAGLPVYTVKSWILGNRIVSVPFATICDPLISTREEFEILWPEIEKLSKGIKSKRIEIRTRHVVNDSMPALMHRQCDYKHHYLSLNEPADTLFRKFSRTVIRKPVNRALREGVTVEERKDEESLRVFHAMLAATRRRHLLPPIPFLFFQELYRSLSPDNIAIYFAIHEGEILGGLMMLKFKDMWYAEYLGTDDKAFQSVSKLLYWHTIQRAKEHGAEYYSFGRTALANNGLLDFKKRWNTTEEDLYDYYSYQKLTSLHGQKYGPDKEGGVYKKSIHIIMGHSPPLVQKIIGDFCYRHLG